MRKRQWPGDSPGHFPVFFQKKVGKTLAFYICLC